jgi:hypothetical protein
MGRHSKPAGGNALQRFIASFTYQPRHNGKQKPAPKRTSSGNARARFASSSSTGGAYMGQGQARVAAPYARSQAMSTTARRRPR